MSIVGKTESGWLQWRRGDWLAILRRAARPLWESRRELREMLHEGLRSTRSAWTSEVARAGQVEERASKLDADMGLLAAGFAVVVCEIDDSGRHRLAFDVFAADLEGERGRADEATRKLTATVHDACAGFVGRIEVVENAVSDVSRRVDRSLVAAPGVARDRQGLATRNMEFASDVEALRSLVDSHRKQFEAWP